MLNSDTPILDSEFVNTAKGKDITVENQTPKLIQNTLETIKSEAPSIETNLLTRRDASESEYNILNQDRVEKRDVENIETLIKNDNTITNSIASVETLESGQTTASLPLNTLEYTTISTDRNGAQFRATNSIATEALLNSTVTQTQIATPQNSEFLPSENEVSAPLEPLEAEQIDLDSIEIDTIDIDENDIFLKRETLQALGTAGAPTNLLGGSPLETTLSNTLNPNFSLGTAQTQVSGTTTLTMPPSAPVATSAHSNAVINTVTQAMLIAKETSQGVMVQIDPPEMGRVYIDFMFESESQVNVVVKSDTVASHDILRERAEHFTQMLKDNGFENINLSFEQQGSDSNNTNSQSDDTEFGADKYIAAEIIEAQDQAYNSALYTSNQDNLRLDIKL